MGCCYCNIQNRWYDRQWFDPFYTCDRGNLWLDSSSRQNSYLINSQFVLQFASELTKLRDGVQSMLPIEREIRCNFFITHDGTERDRGRRGRWRVVKIDVGRRETCILRWIANQMSTNTFAMECFMLYKPSLSLEVNNTRGDEGQQSIRRSTRSL